MDLAVFARVLRVAADECDAIAAEQRQQKHDWIDQHKSALQSKRHCAAVRRLIEAGEPGAARVGRRHLLSAEAYAQELQRVSSKSRKVKPASVADELRAELKLVGGVR